MSTNFITYENQIRRLTRGIVDSGCVIEKKGSLYASKTGNFIYQYTEDEINLHNQQVKVLGSFFSKDWETFIEKRINNIKIQNLLNIPQKYIDISIKCNPNKMPWNIYYGIDLCGDQMRISDLNCDRATIVGFYDEINKVFKKEFPELIFTSFYDSFIGYLNNFYKDIHPSRVYVLTYESDPFKIPISNFANKFRFKAGDIHSLNSKHTDLIIRQVKSEEILLNLSKYSKLINMIESGVPMINPLGSFIAGHKGWMPILNILSVIPSEWFPKSWLVNKNFLIDNEGIFYDIDSAQDLFIDSGKINLRKNFIIKKGFSAGGRHVHIGADLKRYQWVSIWNQIMGTSNETWVVEEKLAPKYIDAVVGDWYGIIDKNFDYNDRDVIVHSKRLNIIKRIYSIFPYESFSSEVFGNDSNKVNASGFTFPASFTDR